MKPSHDELRRVFRLAPASPEPLRAPALAVAVAVALAGTAGAGEPRLVRDIDVTPGWSFYMGLTAAGGRLFFIAGDGEHGRELWTSDGTPPDVSDPIAVLRFLFLGRPAELWCAKAGDADDGGALDLADALSLLSHLFLGGPPPAPPHPGCGPDPTPDGLGCSPSSRCR